MKRNARFVEIDEKSFRALNLFNEKVDKLSKLSFLRHDAYYVNVTQSWDENLPEVERAGPDDEGIDAFILTTRFFIQNNEPTSFNNMSKLYQLLLAPDSDLLKRFLDIHNRLNSYLDQWVIMPLRNGVPTNRLIMEVFVYGSVAHSNKEKRAIFEDWKSDENEFPILEGMLISILLNIYRTAVQMRLLNNELIEHFKEG